MAEDVENPRKKQKLDTLYSESNISGALPSLSDDLATKSCKEDTSLTSDVMKPGNWEKEADQIKPSTSAEDGVGDMGKTSTSAEDGVGDMEKPSTSAEDGVGDMGKPSTSAEDGAGDMGKPDSPSSSRLDASGSSESDSSALSPLSGEDMWKAEAEPLGWVYRMMANGDDPREVLEKILPDHIPDMDEKSLWRLLISIVTEPPPREKLPTINTMEDVIQLIQTCKNIIVLTGAGVSVSCGIPDFRSRNGIYARLAVDFPDLPDPQAMFDINYFRKDQRPFFKFAKEIYPGQFKPSICHQFIRLIEEQEKLLRNYTQNIDTLEQVAGIQNVIQCHGSFATATCMICKHKCSADEIKDKIMDQVIPRCPKCDPPTCWSVMKPDIVFFGESLSDEFHQQMAADKDKCDLLIVIGSSLKVRPVALIPNSLPAHVPQVLINKEHLPDLNFDVELLGDCDIIVRELCRHLGDRWESLANKDNPLREIRVDELLTPPVTPANLRDRRDMTDGKKQETVHDDVSRTKEAEASGEKKVKTSSDDKSKYSEMNKTAGEKGENLTSIEHVEPDICGDDVDRNVNDDSSVVFKKDSNVKGQDDGEQGNSGDAGSSDKTIESREKVVSKSGVTTEDGDMKESDCSTICADKVQENSDAQVEKPQEGETTKNSSDMDLKSMWMPSKWLVSKRLASNQYCYMPPNRYVFNDAELFMVFKDSSDSDHSDDSSDSDSNSDKSNTQDVIMVDEDPDVIVSDSKLEPENIEDELKDTDEISSKGECDILKETSSKEGCGTVGGITDKEGGGISGATTVNKQEDGDI